MTSKMPSAPLPMKVTTVAKHKEKRVIRNPAPCMSIEIRGVVYPSAKHAAKALGVRPITVYAALNRGRLDTVGIGQGKGSKRPLSGRKPKPLKIGNVEFESQIEADRQLGYSAGAVSNILRKGGKQAKEGLVRRVMEYQAKKEQESGICSS